MRTSNIWTENNAPLGACRRNTEQLPVVVPGRLCEAATPMVCGVVVYRQGRGAIEVCHRYRHNVGLVEEGAEGGRPFYTVTHGYIRASSRMHSCCLVPERCELDGRIN